MNLEFVEVYELELLKMILCRGVFHYTPNVIVLNEQEKELLLDYCCTLDSELRNLLRYRDNKSQIDLEVEKARMVFDRLKLSSRSEVGGLNVIVSFFEKVVKGSHGNLAGFPELESRTDVFGSYIRYFWELNGIANRELETTYKKFFEEDLQLYQSKMYEIPGWYDYINRTKEFKKWKR